MYIDFLYLPDYSNRKRLSAECHCEYETQVPHCARVCLWWWDCSCAVSSCLPFYHLQYLWFRPVTRQECQTVPRTQCRPVTQQKCDVDFIEVCRSVSEQQCRKVPQTSCVTHSEQQCNTVFVDSCRLYCLYADSVHNQVSSRNVPSQEWRDVQNKCARTGRSPATRTPRNATILANKYAEMYLSYAF